MMRLFYSLTMTTLVDRQHKNVQNCYRQEKQKLQGLRSTKMLLTHCKLAIPRQSDEQSGMQRHTDQMVLLMPKLYLN